MLRFLVKHHDYAHERATQFWKNVALTTFNILFQQNSQQMFYTQVMDNKHGIVVTCVDPLLHTVNKTHINYLLTQVMNIL